MSEEIIPIKCPACKSDDFLEGSVLQHVWFVPKGEMIISHGYYTEAYCCLNCGHVFHYLTDKSLDQIREKYSSE